MVSVKYSQVGGITINHTESHQSAHKNIKQINMSILLINGPNLNLLGTREPHIYGSQTLQNVQEAAQKQTSALGLTIETFQSNHEGYIIDRIHEARGKCDFVIINLGGLTHTSVALRDALGGVAIPFIEVHISNVHAREEFRHKSFLSDKAVAVICGLCTFGYTAAIDFVAQKLQAAKA
jgi:3-dehydroquinate dehydratase-2